MAEGKFGQSSVAPEVVADLHAFALGVRVMNEDSNVLICQVVDVAGMRLGIHSVLSVDDVETYIADLRQGIKVASTPPDQRGKEQGQQT